MVFTDLPGCMADGATIDEATDEARDAFAAWMMAEEEDGRELPVPDADLVRHCQPGTAR